MSYPRWGVTPQMNPKFAKRIILTNLLGFTFALYMTLSLIAFVWLRLWLLVGITVFFVLIEVTWPFLNRLQYYTLSRLGILISSNLLGFTVSVLLPGTGYNRGFYVMVPLAFLLFSFEEKKFMALGILLPLILYPLSEYTEELIPVAMLGLSLAPEVSHLIFQFTGVIYVGLITLAFYFFARENEHVFQALEEQRARSFSSAKFAALGEMASGIAHEINNPLMAINVTSENLRYMLAQDKIPHDKAFEKLERITKTTERVGSIIHSMRNFSRDAASDPPQVESLQRIFGETLVFCQERFKNNGVDLRIYFPDSEVFLLCRPVQVSQVLLNLLNNSYDAIEELEEKWIEVDIKIDESRRVILGITDSGEGILEENQEKIFEPFFTTKPAGKGTGLGLSISRQIALDHKGDLRLEVESSNTRFELHFPQESLVT